MDLPMRLRIETLLPAFPNLLLKLQPFDYRINKVI